MASGTNLRLRAALLLTALTWVAVSAQPASAAPVPVLVIEGKGHGHGVGMAQDGALAMGKAGKTVEQILSFFFPGTALTSASGSVRVQVADTSSTGSFVLAFPRGGEVRGGSVSVTVGAGGRVSVGFDGSSYTAKVLAGAQGGHGTATATAAAAQEDPRSQAPEGGSTTTTPMTTTTPGTSPAPVPPRDVSTEPLRASAGGDVVVIEARSRQYRGVIEARSDAGRFRLVNEVDVEQYLRGMGEVRNPSWPAAGLEAQAIAARTYALRASGGGRRPGGFHLYDDQRSQVYLGRQAEYAAMDAAVSRTRGRVVTYAGSLAATVYSSSAGGFTATATEGFGPGASNRPYLKAVPYPTADPRSWKVEIALRDVAARLGYRGTISAVRVAAKGPSGRALTVVVEGSAGPLEVSGVSFDAKLGLKSTLFTLRGDTAASAPAPPAPAEVVPFQELFDADSVIVNDSGLLALLEPEKAQPRPSAPPLQPAPATHLEDPAGGVLRRALAVTLVVAALLLLAWAIAVRRSPYVAILSKRARRSVETKLGRIRDRPPSHKV